MPSPAPCAATGHGNRAGAVRGRQPDRHPAGYRSRCQGSGDCSLSSPPGGSSCRHRGLEQRCPLSPRYPQALRSECPAELNATGGDPGPCPLHARWGGPARDSRHSRDQYQDDDQRGPWSGHSLLSWCCRPPRCSIVPAGSPGQGRRFASLDAEDRRGNNPPAAIHHHSSGVMSAGERGTERVRA